MKILSTLVIIGLTTTLAFSQQPQTNPAPQRPEMNQRGEHRGPPPWAGVNRNQHNEKDVQPPQNQRHMMNPAFHRPPPFRPVIFETYYFGFGTVPIMIEIPNKSECHACKKINDKYKKHMDKEHSRK